MEDMVYIGQNKKSLKRLLLFWKIKLTSLVQHLKISLGLSLVYLVRLLARCKHWKYTENLHKTSAIVVFHNEGWSVLMRTVHSVINRTLPQYLEEVLLVDDFPDKDTTKNISFLGVGVVATKMYFGWASGFGAGFLTPIDRTLNSDGYVDILEEFLNPTVRAVFGDEEVINVIEDNSAIHTANIVKEWWRKNPRYRRLELPARSPEINIIENVWAEMVREWKPSMATNQAQLMNRVEQGWEALRARLDYFENLANSVPRRLRQIIENHGASINENHYLCNNLKYKNNDTVLTNTNSSGRVSDVEIENLLQEIESNRDVWFDDISTKMLTRQKHSNQLTLLIRIPYWWWKKRTRTINGDIWRAPTRRQTVCCVNNSARLQLHDVRCAVKRATSRTILFEVRVSKPAGSDMSSPAIFQAEIERVLKYVDMTNDKMLDKMFEMMNRLMNKVEGLCTSVRELDLRVSEQEAKSSAPVSPIKEDLENVKISTAKCSEFISRIPSIIAPYSATDQCEMLLSGVPSSLELSDNQVLKKTFSAMGMKHHERFITRTRSWKPKNSRSVKEHTRAIVLQCSSPIVRDGLMAQSHKLAKFENRTLFDTGGESRLSLSPLWPKKTSISCFLKQNRCLIVSITPAQSSEI
ncbi:unnamed protein product [Trichogramma brassicae]|uniref:Tc1-like transposase DDE domain-containing protein n=1 Tax=Trichogramma brassicae TaxID=86971 RepID=A0A6H5IKT9_9HYME|nr:unnamed protein product [Trichogramma brassicae]